MHRRAFSDDEFSLLLLRLAQMQQFSPHGDDFARAFNRFLKLAEHNGFCQEVVRAVLHRIHSHINFTVSGDQDDRRAEGHPRGFVQQIGAVSIRQLNIQ